MTEATKAAAASWKTTLAAERAPYEQAYASEKERYVKELEQYKSSGKEDVWKERVGIKAQEEKKNQLKLKKKEAAAKEKMKKATALAAAKRKKEAAALAT